MILGSGSHQAGRRRFLLQAATGAAVMLLGTLALSGCGGGSNPGPSPTPTPNVSVTLRGRVIENTTTALVSGATVTFGTQSAVTGNDGQFSFQVAAGTADTNITVSFPAGGYSTVGFIRGQQVSLATGVPVRASELIAGQTVEIGDIKVFSSDGPPPPPVF